MDKVREDFEAWSINYKGVLGLPFFIIKNKDGTYVDGMAQSF